MHDPNTGLYKTKFVSNIRQWSIIRGIRIFSPVNRIGEKAKEGYIKIVTDR